MRRIISGILLIGLIIPILIGVFPIKTYAFFGLDEFLSDLNLFGDSGVAQTQDLFLSKLKKISDQVDKYDSEIARIESIGTPEEKATLDQLRSERDKLTNLGLSLSGQAANIVSDTERVREQALADMGKCSFSLTFDLGACVVKVTELGVSLSGKLLDFSAKIFNNVIQITILDFKQITDGLAVTTLWATVRDLANMMAIFLLLYIALSTILQINTIDTQKTITWLIIAALLINFSAVLTRVAIDGSNVLSLLFYDRFTNANDSQSAPDIAGLFISSAKIDTSYQNSENDQYVTVADSQVNGIAKNLGLIIMLLVTAWVFLMSAGFFIVRAVVFIILIITSPLALMGYVIPWLEKQATNRWWEEFKAQLIFAPVFMGTLYITLNIAGAAKNLTFSGVTDSALGNIIIYVVMIMLLFGSLAVARNSAKGIASSKIKGLGLAGAALAGAGVGAFGSRFGGGAAQRYLDSGRGNKVTRAFANQLATRTWNPMNAIKATDKKISDLASGKGGDFNNRSYTQIQKDREKASKDKVENHKFNMKTMANDQVRANYINGIKNADERKELYKSLSAQDRAKYELAAAGTAAEATLRTLRTEFNNDDDEGRNKNNKARAEEHKKRMKALTTDADKAAYIARIADADERKELYKEIDVGDRGRYEAAATGAVAATLKTLRDGLKDEDQEKTDKALNRASRSNDSEAAKTLLKTILRFPANPARVSYLASQVPPLTIKDVVNTIGPSEITKISRDKATMDRILSDRFVTKEFTPAFLAKISKSLEETDFISPATVTKIYRDLYTTPPPAAGTPEKALNDWFDANNHFR